MHHLAIFMAQTNIDKISILYIIDLMNAYTPIIEKNFWTKETIYH